jgi:hypothetical protein
MMENWAVDFLGVAEKKGIMVNRNGDYGPPKGKFEVSSN